MVSTFRCAAIASFVLGSLTAGVDAAEIEAKSLVLPGQGNAGTTVAASADIRIVGDLAGDSVQLEIVWTDDAVLDGNDPVIGAKSVSFEGIHALTATLPAEASAGTHYVALRAVPLPNELVRSDNVVFAAPVEILVPTVHFASTAPLVFQATSIDPVLAADVTIENEGTPGSFGFFDLTLKKPATWLEIAGASGVAVAGGAPGVASLLIHAQGLVPGVYADALVLTSPNAPHAVQLLQVQLVVGAPWFTPGDRVRTTLAPNAATELRFETLAGMKLAISALALPKGGRIESWVRPVNYDPAETVAVPHKVLKKVKKKALLKTPTSGTYFLRLTNPTANELTIEIQTARLLPKAALPRKATLRAAAPELTALLLPGGTVDATLLANAYLTGPLGVTASYLAGSMSGLGQYTVLATPHALDIAALPVPSGPFVTLRAENFGAHPKARVQIKLTPKQPEPGAALIVLD